MITVVAVTVADANAAVLHFLVAQTKQYLRSMCVLPGIIVAE